jgi:hypothetical protein
MLYYFPFKRITIDASAHVPQVSKPAPPIGGSRFNGRDTRDIIEAAATEKPEANFANVYLYRRAFQGAAEQVWKPVVR